MDERLVAVNGGAHAEQMLAVHEKTATHAYAHIFSEPFPSTDVLARWTKHEGPVILAVRRGDAIGFAAANGDLLEALYVLPSDVGAGLGTALLGAIGPVARLWVLSENQFGRAFNERRGWRWIGVAQGAADHGGVTELLCVR